MRCLVCEGFSWQIICRRCQKEFLTPTLLKRELEEGFWVYSFYSYGEIAPLLHTKHSFIGAEVYRIMASRSFRLFGREFSLESYAIPIDDRIGREGYSHTAILAHALGQEGGIKPLYNRLIPRNRVHYSGKSREYRLSHPRNFIYRGPKGSIILVDDIVTTGTTLREASKVCREGGGEPLFALTLADAAFR
ncbi:MAG: ComF family protein [Epsilonproteobacteria bacterium]|nr:ComF family protein [Campylobacterota bacterium]NPA56689.1 ComF family protein [Campylobacterota bacterium]